MKYVRIPTCLLMKMPTVKHLVGRWFWDTETKMLAKGDKTLKQKKKRDRANFGKRLNISTWRDLKESRHFARARA